MVKQIAIEVTQLPPASSSGNARVHWTDRRIDAQIFGKAVYCESVNMRNRLSLLPFPGTTRVSLTFIFPNKRSRDRDNFISRFKPGLDNLVKAGLLRDDNSENVILGDVKFVVDPGRSPLTIILLEEV
jgi:Holliday junction resolvase RusA-like endonuclease